MNIYSKFLNKYDQFKFSDRYKRYDTMKKWGVFQEWNGNFVFKKQPIQFTMLSSIKLGRKNIYV